MGVIVQRKNEHATAVKENDGGRWSSDCVVLWLGTRQNGDVVVWCSWQHRPEERRHQGGEREETTSQILLGKKNKENPRC
jgi:hypothetical protein